MMMRFISKLGIQLLAFAVVMTTILLGGCGEKGRETSSPRGGVQSKHTKRNVKIVLDWTPNTHHTGLYVAKQQGFYKAAGLNVEIVQPGIGESNTMIVAGEAQFGISGQSSISLARAQGVPIVSIAAIIQHNTSGFAAPKDRQILSPKDFEGKTYGGWGSPVEEMMLRTLMEKDGADYNKLKHVNMGIADFFTAVKQNIDFAWVYYAWQGITAELRQEPIDMIYVNQFSDKLDFYTPVIATSEKLIQDEPQLVQAFMRATSAGYRYAIAHPEEAAKFLLKAVPELDRDLVVASQKWLSSKYQADAVRWGEQKRSVWDNYSSWLFNHKLLEKAIDVDKAYTNQFLPPS